MEVTQAVILAGGRGRRLLPFTSKNPKPMIPVNNKPFLWFLIKMLKENGIEEIIILTGYLGESIEKYFGNGSNLGIKIKYSYTPFLVKDGDENMSGSRLKNAQGLLDSYFLLLYCDNYWPLQLFKLVEYYKSHPSDVLVTVYSNKDNSTKNNILVDNSGYVLEYDKKRTGKSLNGVEIGYFIVNKKVLMFLPKGNSKFEDVVLQILIQERKLAGFLTDQKYYSISDIKRVNITEKFLKPKKVIFLDRDGVINKKPPKADYVKKWEEFEFLPNAIEAIKLLNKNDYKIYLITNQPGIGRGLMTKKNLNLIHRNMRAILKKHGAKINGIYYCPHDWDDNCICRKPKPGLLIKASQDHLFDLTKVIFIGDDKRDKEAGETAGCKTILVNAKKNLLQIARQISG